MASIHEYTFAGGNNLSHGTAIPKRTGEKHLAPTLQEVADDLGDILVALQTITTKLDADVGVTDTDYRSILDGIVATLKTVRI